MILASPDTERARCCFPEAIRVARGQKARMAELRAATALAQMGPGDGSGSDAHALLDPILAQIECGGDTRDVRRARALLAEAAEP